jgi:hypothetical protein
LGIHDNRDAAPFRETAGMGRRARTRRIGWALLVVGLTAGCGTTVDLAATPATTGAAGDTLTVPTATPGASLAPGVTAPGDVTGGVQSGVSGGGTAPGAVATGAPSGGYVVPPAPRSGGEGGVPAAAAPGITDTKVYLGLVYSDDAAAANRAIGASGAAASYDTRDVFNAVIRYANAHGGFAGRQAEGIYYDLSVTEDLSVQAQAACEKWTNDNKVFVMEALRSDILRACAEKAGAVSIVGGDGIKSTFERFPHFFDPTAIRLDRLGNVTVGGLAQANYFSGRLGLVTWDDTNYRFALQHGYIPALAARGIKPAIEPVYISVPQQIGALADMTAAVSSAVTKFAAAHIDHVIIQDGPAGVWAGGGLTLEWMNQAKSQHYKPRYGQNAYNLPGSNVLPADQMDRAIAIMESDEDARNDEGWHLNQTREKCYKIQAQAGMPVKSSNSGDQSFATQACDQIFFIQQAMNSVDGVITNDSFARAVEAFGTSFKSAGVYGTKFAPGLHDGAAMVRTAQYFASCKCLKYSGPPYYTD